MIYIKKTLASNNGQFLFFLFIVLSVFSCENKVNTESIFIRDYPTQINDNKGIKNIFIDSKYIYVQENNFICDQTFLHKRSLLKSEKDSIGLILSQISPNLDKNSFKTNEYYADYYYIIDLIGNKSQQIVIFQDQIPKEFKTLINVTKEICQRGVFETLNTQFSNMNMNLIHLISTQNDTIAISALSSFLLWKKLNTNDVRFNFTNHSDTTKFDYKIPILYNLDCENEFTYFMIKGTKLFIIDKDGHVFHLTGDYSFLLKEVVR